MNFFEKPHRRLPLLLMAMASLFAGLWAALMKLGWVGVQRFSPSPFLHGALMVSGFLGTLISLERAVALGVFWGYLGPLFCGLGAIAALVVEPRLVGIPLICAGSAVFFLCSWTIMRRQLNFSTGVLTGATLFWIAGNGIWLARGWHFSIVLSWMCFLLLTISGERFELSRFLVKRSSLWFNAAIYGGIGLLVLGTVLSCLDVPSGARLVAAGMILQALWLLRHDLAHSNLSHAGLPRYIAVSLISGYFWLLVAGVIGGAFDVPEFSLQYDAELHAFFLGFVMSMIFAHAPIIFPSILQMPIPYSRRFYHHFILLHLGLLIRVGSDLLGWVPGWRWGGLLNVLAVLLFLANNVHAALVGSGRAMSVKKED